MSLPSRWLFAALILVSAGCKVNDPGLTILVTTEDEALVRDGLAFIGDSRIHTKIVASPEKELASREGVVIALSTSEACTECYRLEGAGTLLQVRGGGPLGRQYGLWHAMEALGYRFPHPRYTKVPTEFTAARAEVLGVDFSPEVKKRRGLHLHTLHPIETLYDFWIPSPENLVGAQRAIDFLIKNRGNYLQWCALDDIVKTPAIHPAWKAHTKAITDFAHAHGVSTGIALQLFGQSNLQNAYDLIDDTTVDPVPEMERRLHVLLDGTGFDSLALSFGEFFGAEPARFVAEVDSAYATMQRVQPGVEVTASIHVGNYDNLRVDFMGERQLYYFLVKFTNPAIVPWVHTTMFYNLYEDTGLAYLHEQFDEHRAYLEGRIREGKRVGYFPESAYWVAFDINIPVFVPLYIRSRHLDLERIAAVGELDDHVLFSSGWEWGYWLTDATTLRMSYQRPAKWDDSTADFYAGWGATGATAAELVRKLAEAQHRAMIIERLAAYVASRDQIIDAGDRLGIFSQPDRPEFSEVLAMTPAEREQFRVRVVEKLKVHADELTVLATEADALPSDDPVMAELKEGVQVTAARVRFIQKLYAATVANDGALITSAEADLALAKELVAKRRRAMWDPDPKTILRNTPNPTFYQYGYLREGDTLCFWERERAQVRNAVLSAGQSVPGCVL
jgi:hypothetical protein